MANSESSTNMLNYKINWDLSDNEIIADMNEIIQALNNKKIDAATILPKLSIGLVAGIHMFGTSGNDRCTPKLVSTWLSLLVLLASSDEVTGQSIASSFTKGCGGCMVYTILMAVACYPSEVITKLAFDFFCHVLVDPKGEMLELHEVTAISSLLNQHVPYRQDGTMMRTACLELSVIGGRVDSTTIKGQTIHALRDFIEGLGTLCTSKTFVIAMKENSISTIQIIKESIMNKTFSRKFVEKKWP